MEEESMDIGESSLTPPSSPAPTPGSAAALLVGAEVVGGEEESHAVRISMAEYNMQAQEYTQQALRELKASPEYKKHSMRCHSCRSSWYDGEFSADCAECGGFAFLRACPVCDGHCASMWKRNTDMSHKMKEAHWDGSCSHQNANKLLEELIHMDHLTSSMQQLKTHQQTK